MNKKNTILNTLQAGLAYYNLQASTEQQEKICEFLFTLEKWSKVHNLTAITKVEEMLTKHVLDSLAVTSFISHGNILDVGTGAGLPGLPLAIIKPDIHFVLLDSNRKKTAFVQHVITQVGLTNITVVHTRVENYKPPVLFDVIVSRAFAELGEFITSCSRLCHKDGFFIAMKGKVQQAKRESLPYGYLLTKIETITVPGLLEERCLVFVRKQNEEKLSE